MKNKLNCILLVDDNQADNRYHQIIIEEMKIANRIDLALNGKEALNYLKKENQVPPDLIFLDINMPAMNGWEFLEEYKNLNPGQKAKIVIVVLTTSSNPDDFKKAQAMVEVNGFETKPLSEEMILKILGSFFYDK